MVKFAEGNLHSPHPRVLRNRLEHFCFARPLPEPLRGVLRKMRLQDEVQQESSNRNLVENPIGIHFKQETVYSVGKKTISSCARGFNLQTYGSYVENPWFSQGQNSTLTWHEHLFISRREVDHAILLWQELWTALRFWAPQKNQKLEW